MLADHERIAREMTDSKLVRLHRKLERLSSVLTIMNTGAHPDDEANGMLAALRFGLGMRIVVACSTRGEGGQNGIGPERGAALAVLRTREMEVAARVIDADVAWLGHGPDDPVHDFGFSKNGDDTLSRWGEDRIIERLVRAYREERPDIVIPTFLDVPGQHGHHRAMTRAAEIAFERAADPSFYPHQIAEGLKPWRVAKFYLPAWSGGGTTYDDEIPPPPTTLVVELPKHDRATGVPFARIGEWSRLGHLSQGMGVWLESPPRSWPLHLLKRAGESPGREKDIRDGLAANVGDLARIEGLSEEFSGKLLAAQEAIDAAQSGFPDQSRILEAASEAARLIESLLASCPDIIVHRLERKLKELDAVILEAGDVSVRGWTSTANAVPSGTVKLHVALESPGVAASATPVLPEAISIAQVRPTEYELSIAENAAFTTPYPSHFRVLGKNGEVALEVRAKIHGRDVRAIVDLEEPLRIVPEHSVTPDQDVIILTPEAIPNVIEVDARWDSPAEAGRLSLEGEPGWQVSCLDHRISLRPPADLTPGLYRFKLTIDNATAYRIAPIAYPHIGRTSYFSPATLSVLVLDVSRGPEIRIGYVGSGNDRVGSWLARLGYDVTELDAKALQQDLSQFDSIVVGIFVFANRPDLAAARTRLHRFVEQGGHLVTLYHRPVDGWDPELTPPQAIEIGSPSLRWRVSDPTAPVSVLAPEHPLLTYPNRIGPDDWGGWDKERGLYFASRWSEAYSPLVAMSDRGEKPLSGGLISGRIGNGRHTHVSLALHHQLDKLVPGAFRILANLVQPA